jgi:hypothetical protein
MFHRLTVPTYFGGLPAGFDYINTPSLSGGSGVPAFMDGKKVGGPNDGTYAVAFGEDATSNFANRGIKALAENTDIIDNLLRRDLAISARTLDVTAGADVPNVVITGDFFVGIFGTANNQGNRDLLVSILDSNDNEILNAGTKVVALAIVDNSVSMTNVVGTQTSGFYDTPTIVFNVPIPSGTTYRIYYGERSNLATLPQDAFTTIKIRGAQEVTATVERLFLFLHGGSLAWDAAWPASISSLAQRGLNGTYRLDTTESALPYNTPGAGGFFVRDGRGITARIPSVHFDTCGQIGQGVYYPDPVLACLRLEPLRLVVGPNYNQEYGGDVGLYQESPWRSTADSNEGAYDFVPGPLVLDVAPRLMHADTLAGSVVSTRITPTAVATLNPTAGTASTDLATVDVASGDYLTDGSGNQAIRVNDLIEVTDNATGQVLGTYRLYTTLSSTRMLLRAVTGVFPAIGLSGVASPVRLRWLQPTMQLGGRYREAADTAQGFPYFTIAAPAPSITPYSAANAQLNAIFLSAIIDRAALASGNLHNAMAWGGFSGGSWFVRGLLDGDGSISCSGGRQAFQLLNRRNTNFAVNAGGRSISWNPYSQGSHIQIYTSAALTTSSPISFAIDTSTGYVPTAGDEFDIDFIVTAGTTLGVLSMTWPVDFVFPSDDDVVPDGYVPGGPNPGYISTHYRFRYVSSPSATGWFATREDF